VSVQIENTGKTDGDEVPQVYLGAPVEIPTGVAFPVRSSRVSDCDQTLL
jgi:beta-glucosidase